MSFAARNSISPATASSVDEQQTSIESRHVMADADDRQLPYSIRHMPEDISSIEALAEHCGCETSQVLKTVLYRGKISIKPSLLLIPGDRKIDERKIYALIGEVLVPAEETLVRRRTGFAPSILPPLGLAVPIAAVMDEQLLRHTHLWCLAGDSRVAISFPSEKLSFALAARIASIT